MRKYLLSCVLVLTAALPAAAQTEGLITPFIGVAFDTPNDEEKRLVYGGALGFTGPIVGFEVDYGYSPNFYEAEDELGEFGREGSVTTLMGNILLSIPNRQVKPYFTAGVGLMRSNLTFVDFFDDVSRNDLGINIGGGVMVFLGDKVAIRGDIRQFRNLNNDDEDDDIPDPTDFDLGDFKFWRGSAGVTFRF
jgi:opacity protein-like surface antigen